MVLCALFQRELQRPVKPSRARFSQVKPVGQVSLETLKAVESFLGQEDVLEHDVYLCSGQPSPEPWLSSHPEVTWLRIQADEDRNGKAATLAQSQRYWSGEIFVVSDSDMWAEPTYLAKVLAEFEDPKVGVVTCLYRSTSPTWGDWCHLFEALCILDFSSSVLVARQTEGISFAMGSTMAVRRSTLEEIGGFEALVPYLADDYQLGQKAHKAGWKVRLAASVLETEPPKGRLEKALAHQYRWLVTSRVSRPGGHLAFIVTQGFLWALLLMLVSPGWGVAAMLLWWALRIGCGAAAFRRLGGQAGLWQVLFYPWKDALYLGLWLASLKGRSVTWGERRLTIDTEGKIVSQRRS